MLSVVAIRLSINWTKLHNISDRPGEHKQHDESTPFVGGIGVLVALCAAIVVLSHMHPQLLLQWLILGFCATAIFIVGFVDDALQLGYRLRLIVQIVVASFMVMVGGSVLNDLGDLFFGQAIQLGLFAIPFTVFAVIGSINAFNMIDGVDGLSGMISLVSLLLIGIIAFVAGNQHALILTAALAGGVVGFLYFNLRYFSQYYAQVFLGDNGSMLLGILFAWLLIELSQGSTPAITPVTAIWLFSIPLMDTVSVIVRRIWLGKSPFIPDRHHLHHLLLSAGFRIIEVVYIIALLHFLFGIIGLVGFYLGVSEFAMFISFLMLFLVYCYLIVRPWRFIPILRSLHARFYLWVGLVSVASCGTFYGSHTAKEAMQLIRKISDRLGHDMHYWLWLYEQPSVADHGCGKRYAITLNVWLSEDDCDLGEDLSQYTLLLNRRLKGRQNIQVRQLAGRLEDSDFILRRKGRVFGESRTSDRRKLASQVLVFEIAKT